MNGYEMAAIAGALSWAYPIGVWIHRIFQKPSIRIIPAEYAEIGYTHFGPLLNFRCAITTEKKDAVIERLVAEIRHEKGDKYTLVWKFLDETQFEIAPYSGEGGGYLRKYELAIALKVSTSIPTQKLVGFQYDEFKRQADRLVLEMSAQLDHLKRVSPETATASIVTTREYTELTKFFENNMIWKAGKYSLAILGDVISLSSPHREEFQFTLTDSDIEVLKRNAKMFEELLAGFLGPDYGTSNALPPQPKWGWVNAKILKV